MVSVVKRPMAERFWEKVDKSTDCWLWTGACDQYGYGRFAVDGREATHHTDAAHRVSYELTIGPIPSGLVLDHLCRTTRCVNPAHLEPVTQAENVRRGAPATATHCRRGHLFEPRRPGRRRICRPCATASKRAWRANVLMAGDSHSAMHFAARLGALGRSYLQGDPDAAA